MISRKLLLITLIFIIPLKGLFALFLGDFLAKIFISIFLVFISIITIFFCKNNSNLLNNKLGDYLLLIYILYISVSGFAYGPNLFLKGFYSIFVLIMPIVSFWTFRINNFSLINKPYTNLTIGSIFGLGYILNFIGINFSERYFSSSLSEFRFSSFYGSTTTSGIWALFLLGMLMNIKFPKFLNLYSIFIQILLLVGLIFSFQRNVYGAFALLLIGMIFYVGYILFKVPISIFFTDKFSKKDLKTLTSILLVITISLTGAKIFFPKGTLVLSKAVITRFNIRTDKSNKTRNSRHEKYWDFINSGNIFEKSFGRYPSVGNAGAAISLPKNKFLIKNTESYFIKLGVERGYIGIFLFSIILVTYLWKNFISFINLILNSIDNEDLKLLITVNSLSLGIVLVLFNLQYLDTPLGSLVFGLGLNESISINNLLKSKYLKNN